MRLMVGFLVLNCPRVDMVAVMTRRDVMSGRSGESNTLASEKFVGSCTYAITEEAWMEVRRNCAFGVLGPPCLAPPPSALPRMQETVVHK